MNTDKATGMLVGLAIGDALGAVLDRARHPAINLLQGKFLIVMLLCKPRSISPR